jgi:hypothetical protein
MYFMVKNRRKYEETVVVNNSATIVKQKQTMYMQALEILHTTYASLVLLVLLVTSILVPISHTTGHQQKFPIMYILQYNALP